MHLILYAYDWGWYLKLVQLVSSFILVGFPAIVLLLFSEMIYVPDSKVHGANMGPTWVLSAPDGPHVSPMNLAIRGDNSSVISLL